ncbi:MAG: DegT/DnrJ/EryC1/StrS family aminotransferase [Phycisphaerales bacterium]|nr:DegT/DnrJ/EryC1/StrS family aminotransferase [Phycisphaerales bacterium]
MMGKGLQSQNPRGLESAARMDIPLARPNISQAEIDAVVAVLRTPNLSLGPKVVEFERAFAQRVGVREAIAVSSGTAALHILIRALGLGPSDEVITTPFSFVASANCILYERATPVFADIDPHTWNIDPSKIEAAITPRTKAIIPVDAFGQPADFDAIRDLALRHGLFVLEDSCEALGATYKGRRAGSLGDAGVFGFYPNKQITTGEGGMITTDDGTLADLCRSLRNQGRDAGSSWLAHPRMGFNYRLPDINSALGLAQLQRLDELLAARAEIAAAYLDALAPLLPPKSEIRDPKSASPLAVPGLLTQRQLSSTCQSWFVFVVRLADRFSEKDRDRILQTLRAAGIGCSNYFAPIHLQPFYREQFGFKPGDFPACEHVAARTIALPFHHELTRAQLAYVCETLKLALGG